MKNLFILILVLFATAIQAQQVDIVKTFRVERPAKIEVPGDYQILTDNTLPKGIVKMVLMVRHNANEEVYNQHLLKRIAGRSGNQTGYVKAVFYQFHQTIQCNMGSIIHKLSIPRWLSRFYENTRKRFSEKRKLRK